MSEADVRLQGQQKSPRVKKHLCIRPCSEAPEPGGLRRTLEVCNLSFHPMFECRHSFGAERTKVGARLEKKPLARDQPFVTDADTCILRLSCTQESVQACLCVYVCLLYSMISNIRSQMWYRVCGEHLWTFSRCEQRSQTPCVPHSQLITHPPSLPMQQSLPAMCWRAQGRAERKGSRWLAPCHSHLLCPETRHYLLHNLQSQHKDWSQTWCRAWHWPWVIVPPAK